MPMSGLRSVGAWDKANARRESLGQVPHAASGDYRKGFDAGHADAFGAGVRIGFIIGMVGGSFVGAVLVKLVAG
jgi:hypothetical protein